MSLRILHVMSSNFFAGSVAYALQLAEGQQARGHDVIIATDKSGLSGTVTCVPLPISDRSWRRRIGNILALRRIVRDHAVDIVHAHSRAASWVAHYALTGTGIPFVSTIHGRQVKRSRFKSMSIYGEKVIAICPELREHLVNQMGMERSSLACLPNPLDFERLKAVGRTRQQDGRLVISVVGRFNGPKGDHIATLVTEVFPRLLEEFPALSIQLAGGEWESFPRDGREAYAELHARFGQRIVQLGFSGRVLEMMADSDVVIGAGRVAMEALALGVPLFAVGEACCHGFVTPDNLERAIATNFGDILVDAVTFTPDSAAILRELTGFAAGKREPPIDPAGLQIYDPERIMGAVLEIYGAAIMKKLTGGRAIPVLMYHRVPDGPLASRHKTFVTRQNFERHLRFFSRRGLQSITFRDYLDFATGTRPRSGFPRKPFILTFDDGYRDNFTNMLPIAERYGFCGVIFLLGDFSATANFWDDGEALEGLRLMTTDQKKAFVSAGWEIGAHTMTHPDLTRLADDEVMHELNESRRCLERELQTEVISFAYPFGHYDERVKKLARESGFDFGIATDNGGMTIDEDRFAVFRVNMFPNESLFSLYKKTSVWYRSYYRRKRGK